MRRFIEDRNRDLFKFAPTVHAVSKKRSLLELSRRGSESIREDRDLFKIAPTGVGIKQLLR